MVFREPLVALLVGLVRRASAVEGDVVVVATVAPTTVALFAPTLLTFNVTDMVLGAEAFVKVIAPGGGSSCEAVPGVSDAISGGAAQLTYVSATQGTWSATLAAKPLPGYTVCYSETGGAPLVAPALTHSRSASGGETRALEAGEPRTRAQAASSPHQQPARVTKIPRRRKARTGGQR